VIDLSDEDFSSDDWQEIWIDLSTQEYSGRSVWKQIALDASASQVRAFIEDPSIHASGDLALEANTTARLGGVVGPAAVGASGGSRTGVAVSAAGVYTENKIWTDVQAFIDGDGADAATDGITAASVQVVAMDSSNINAVAGAGALAASFGASAGVSLSIGLS